MSSPLSDQTFVALDFETTGKYPLTSEICEVALIKFKGDQVLDRFESYVRPLKGMTKESEKVHGLSLESLKDAPDIKGVLTDMLEFIGDSPLVGHNITFDLGFLAYEFERLIKTDFSSLKRSHLCTSYLSLSLWPKLRSHRLIHLAQHIELKLKPNHRAMQDAEVCMLVFLELIKNFNSLEELLEAQKVDLNYKYFSISELAKSKKFILDLATSCEDLKEVEIKYSKGSKKNQWRTLNPKGLVLKENELGFFVATDPGDQQTKRFMLSKIVEARLPNKRQ